jgi:hypothetical protein
MGNGHQKDQERDGTITLRSILRAEGCEDGRWMDFVDCWALVLAVSVQPLDSAVVMFGRC